MAVRGAGAAAGEQMRRIGVLLPTTADDVDYQAWLGAFHQGLAQSGWIIGRNVRIDTRWAGNKANEVRRHAAELVALAPDVILAQTRIIESNAVPPGQIGLGDDRATANCVVSNSERVARDFDSTVPSLVSEQRPA